MDLIDYTIVVLYLGGLVLVGLHFKKKASEGIDSYFLGGRTTPWWVLGASGMASNFDMTGTMINTALIHGKMESPGTGYDHRGVDEIQVR